MSAEIDEYFDKLTKSEYPVLQNAFTANTLMEYLWKDLCGNKNPSISYEDFSIETKHVLGQKIDIQVQGDKGAMSIINDLSPDGHKEAKTQILRLFYMAKCRISTKKDLTSPYKYFMKVYRSEMFDEVKKEENREDMGKMFFLNEELINRYSFKLQKQDPVNFISFLLYQNFYGNTEIEKHILNPIIEDIEKEYNTNSRNLLVIDPLPWVMEYCRMHLKDKVSFLFFSKELSELFSLHYRKTIPNESVKVYYCSKSEQDKKILITEVANSVTELPFTGIQFTDVFISAHENLNEIKELFLLLNDLISDGARIDFMLPNNWIDKDHELRRMICREIKLDRVSILPTAPITSELKKHVHIICHNEKCSESYNFTLQKQHFLIEKNTNSQIKGYIINEPWVLSADTSMFDDSIPKNQYKTINKLFEMLRPRKEKRVRSTSKEYRFSKEITIQYSWKNGRGRIAYYSTPTQHEDGTWKKREKLIEIPIKAATEEKVLAGIKRRIYVAVRNEEEKEERKVKFSNLIIDDITGAYLSIGDKKEESSISLKSYWICRGEILKEKRYYRFIECSKIFESEMISDIKNTDFIDVTILAEEIKHITGEKDKEKINKFLRQLNIILREANSEGLFKNQSVSSYISKLNAKDRGYKEVRKGLVKRSYSDEEAKRIFEYLVKRYNGSKSGKYLGALISYFTGASNREVAALLGEDIRNMYGLKIHQFLIYKELDNNGVPQPIPPKRKERYRRVPIVQELDNLLQAHLKFREGELSCYEISERSKMPLLYVKEDKKIRFIRPTDIRDAKVEAETKALKLKKEMIGFAKVNEKDIETDFNNYEGDRFRTNLEYQLLATCQMERSDANYIFGRVQKSTYAKHYCDYTNDGIQLALKAKMERWSSGFVKLSEDDHNSVEKDSSDKTSAVKKNKIRKTGKIIPEYRTVEKLSTFIQAGIVDKSNKVEITVMDNRGVDVVVDIVEEK